MFSPLEQFDALRSFLSVLTKIILCLYCITHDCIILLFSFIINLLVDNLKIIPTAFQRI